MMAAVARSPPRWALNSQLLLAIRTQDVGRASKLLKAGVDVDTKFAINALKKPALYLSVESNDVAMVQLLLRLGASVNHADSIGETPLLLACSRGYMTLVEMLLQQARPNINARTLQGTTALHAAAAQGSRELVETLLSHGADVKLQDKNGRSALHIATTVGCADICRSLIEAGAHAAVLDSMNNTPLHYAVSRTGINIENIQLLISKCPQALCITNKFGETPLIIAIRSGRSDIEYLLKAVLKLAMVIMPNLCHTMILGHRTDRGHTPLHLAVLEKQIACIRVLLAAGAEVDSRNHLGQTPLASAARDGNYEIVALLVAAGASTRTLVNRDTVDAEVKDPTIALMLRESFHAPPKLTSVCRRSLSRLYGLSGSLDFQLPLRWIDFLNFESLEL
uniref:Tankyrase-like n=2 Tax=Hirondellea gigas TaxID=1518452 RepID=A0A2P2HYP9_9CRUS